MLPRSLLEEMIEYYKAGSFGHAAACAPHHALLLQYGHFRNLGYLIGVLVMRAYYWGSKVRVSYFRQLPSRIPATRQRTVAGLVLLLPLRLNRGANVGRFTGAHEGICP